MSCIMNIVAAISFHISHNITNHYYPSFLSVTHEVLAALCSGFLYFVGILNFLFYNIMNVYVLKYQHKWSLKCKYTDSILQLVF